MKKSQLIQRVLEEVEDPALRDALLRQISSDTGPANPPNIAEQFGLDPLGVQRHGRRVVGYHVATTRGVSVIFIIAGSLGLIGCLLSGHAAIAVVGSIFASIFLSMGLWMSRYADKAKEMLEGDTK